MSKKTKTKETTQNKGVIKPALKPCKKPLKASN